MNTHKPYGLYEKYFKRMLDVLCSLAAILVFWWLYLIIAILVRAKLGSPIIFTQKRPGKNEKIFKLYKFRTMTDKRDENGELLSDEERLTRFGRMLRATSLDELPEAFNILKGDMSIVGPRPLLVKYLNHYTESEKIRHTVRPGLSGLAQVSGRNFLEWDKRLQKDIDYVNRITFLGDIKIVFLTAKNVLKRSDVASGEQLILKDLDDDRRNTSSLCK